MRRKAYRNEIFSMWESVIENNPYPINNGDTTMTDLKVGDRVTYVGSLDGKYGKTYTIRAIRGHHAIVDGDCNFEPRIENLRHVNPNTITINRADLPKVTGTGDSLHCGEHDYFTDTQFPAAKHRQLALQQLAVAEFLDAREKEADAKRDKRRDELAEKFAPGARWSRLSQVAQRAIDYIIADEDKTHG